MTLRKTLRAMYAALTAHYGPTHWWPGDTPFEIAVGAILTQNTTWTSVERAIANLTRARLLSPRALLDCDTALLEECLRPSGYFRVKTRRLRSFCAYLVERYGGSMKRMARAPLDVLRAELLAVDGIGPETADDILLYACDKTVFVVDAYTRRILSRHGLCAKDIGYDALQACFEKSLEPDRHTYAEYHGLIVYAGKDFCRRSPKCDACPLKPFLPEGGPLL